MQFGPTWESPRLVAFESRQLNGAEQNYPVHEQEMLVIVRALKKWRVDLLGTHIHICTDHKTLQNFDFQRDLSQCQARWMEYMSQYEYSITYIHGERNTVADALSRLPDSINEQPLCIIAASMFTIESDPRLITQIKNGYWADPWCVGILDDFK